MSRELKIDLHTHPIEALEKEMGIKGILDINKEVAKRIVEAIKAAGLDGIAITEHRDFNRSWVACLEIMKNFPKENLIILPGWKKDHKGSSQQYLEIFIPDYLRKCFKFFNEKEWFRIFAHPGHYKPFDIAGLENLEKEVGKFDAVEERSKHGEFKLADEISKLRNIPKIKTSDAHQLEEIGLFYMKLEFDPKKMKRRGK